MIRKIIILSLIFSYLNCSTTSMLIESVKKKKDYRPYEGTMIDIFLIALGPFGVFYGKNTTLPFISGVIDLPFSFVLDTILLPGTIPYYIYVKSGKPWSEEWYHQKHGVSLKSFRDRNPSYDTLKLIVAENDFGALQEFIKSNDVVALEKKIRVLQEDNLLPYEHRDQGPYYPEIGIMDYMAAFFSKGEPYNYRKRSNPISLSDRLEFAYLLYEEFRKDPILEKRYYDTVWKSCFSSGTLIENRKVLKKMLQEFSEKKEISDLFISMAREYSEQRYKHYEDPFDDPYYFFDKGKIQKISEHWYNRIELLEDLDTYLKNNPKLQKEWRRTAWSSAISSGVIAYNPVLLDKAFREFPKEAARSVLNIFLTADKAKNNQSINIITRNLVNAEKFRLGELHESKIENILRYPNLLEKLLQNGWDPNSIFKRAERKFSEKIGGPEFKVQDETSLLMLSARNASIPIATVQILLKYGAKPDLKVKEFDHKKNEYLLVSPEEDIRQKLERGYSYDLIDFPKDGPLQTFYRKYPIYSVLKSFAEDLNVSAFKKTLSDIDLIPMEKEIHRLQKEYIVPTEIPRVNRNGSDKTSISGEVSSSAKVYFKYKEPQECYPGGKYSEAIEIQRIFYKAIETDKDLKHSFLDQLGKKGSYWEDPIFSEQFSKLLLNDKINWSGFELESLVQHTEALEFLMSHDSNMETELKHKLAAVSLFCQNSKSANSVLKYFVQQDYRDFPKEYINFLLYDSKILELFLKNGMNPNATGKRTYFVPSGCPLLLTALVSPNSWDGREKLIQMLLKYGANPNLPTITILHEKKKNVSVYPLQVVVGTDRIANRLRKILKTAGADETLLPIDFEKTDFPGFGCQ
ncbi:YceK/YidQ family lipoprotein [Leptospira gomenensis]|uniref:YceK/YidQ family lipoprotein n=1 Tax=Leptospira gomenensis TaxID=2484974 RepID=A0A5F1YD30_9LEPT|nr:YceK/YidQ family lipoprotein [Leptospira gomenensis]TGK35901.1 YceK/YidQ family lipoprotein [Leptospira gomenensis]TGK40067.1 YceK/YidQ family lipoprotein [Leptospira gomenensis]TGK51517.1 YceK/YidQ family lipoprotein [Leptospira gomenensis]TGK68074.1 YceK/YidQ family lipoprotein [Leptospira gomenensis]